MVGVQLLERVPGCVGERHPRLGQDRIEIEPGAARIGGRANRPAHVQPPRTWRGARRAPARPG